MATRPRSLSMGDLIRSSNPYLSQVHARRLQSMMARDAERETESAQALAELLFSTLPKLTEQDVEDLGHRDSSCPICLTPFLAILTEEEMALALDTPAHPTEDLGVTKLTNCGHLFCVKDIRCWVLQGHNTCPACRNTFINLPRTTVQEGTGDALNELGRHAEEQLLANAVTELYSLTSEQIDSLRSAITLLLRGDRPDSEVELPQLALPPEAQHAVAEEEEEDDRESFAMYS